MQQMLGVANPRAWLSGSLRARLRPLLRPSGHIVTHIRNVWRVGGRCHFQPLALSSKPLRRPSGAGIDGAGARVALLETIGGSAAKSHVLCGGQPLYVL